MSFRKRTSSSDGPPPPPLPRDVRVAALARGASTAGDEMAVIALLLHVAGLGDNRGVALVMAAGALPLLLLAPWAGLLADRLPTRTALVSTGLVQVAACLGLAAAVAAGSALPVLLALVAVISAAQAVNGPAWAALVPTLVPDAEVPRAVGAVQTSMTAALVVAPVAAGLLVGGAGPAWPLVADAATFVIVVVAALVLRQPRVPRRTEGARKPSAWAGLLHVKDDPVLRALALLVGLFVLAVGAVNVVEVLLITQVLGASPAVYGLVGAAFAVGLLAGNRAGARVRGEAAQARALVGGAAVLIVAMLVLAASPTVAVAAVASAVVGVGNGLLSVCGQVLTVARTPDEVRGRVFAAIGGSFQAASLVALAIGGALLGPLGPRGVVAAAAVGCGVAVAFTAPVLLRRTRRGAGGSDPGRTAGGDPGDAAGSAAGASERMPA